MMRLDGVEGLGVSVRLDWGLGHFSSLTPQVEWMLDVSLGIRN